ncbi:MAG: type II toxin-antitoxin system Phd/YefM family antitoxin [Deltaproteobacteria bacterium]|nr:type II toxin-antitoxin system Phd/YefM family antitoxin [Deltaproteobacteria bacterium]
MIRVRISELKSQLARHVRAAETGQVIEVLDRARPVARLVAVPRDDEALEVVPPRRPFASVRRVRLPRLKLAMSSSDALRAEREGR